MGEGIHTHCSPCPRPTDRPASDQVLDYMEPGSDAELPISEAFSNERDALFYSPGTWKRPAVFYAKFSGLILLTIKGVS